MYVYTCVYIYIYIHIYNISHTLVTSVCEINTPLDVTGVFYVPTPLP